MPWRRPRRAGNGGRGCLHPLMARSPSTRSSSLVSVNALGSATASSSMSRAPASISIFCTSQPPAGGSGSAAGSGASRFCRWRRRRGRAGVPERRGAYSPGRPRRRVRPLRSRSSRHREGNRCVSRPEASSASRARRASAGPADPNAPAPSRGRPRSARVSERRPRWRAAARSTRRCTAHPVRRAGRTGAPWPTPCAGAARTADRQRLRTRGRAARTALACPRTGWRCGRAAGQAPTPRAPPVALASAATCVGTARARACGPPPRDRGRSTRVSPDHRAPRTRLAPRARRDAPWGCVWGGLPSCVRRWADRHRTQRPPSRRARPARARTCRTRPGTVGLHAPNLRRNSAVQQCRGERQNILEKKRQKTLHADCRCHFSKLEIARHSPRNTRERTSRHLAQVRRTPLRYTTSTAPALRRASHRPALSPTDRSKLSAETEVPSAIVEIFRRSRATDPCTGPHHRSLRAHHQRSITPAHTKHARWTAWVTWTCPR